ncbi:LemA family protein [Vreelandella stevensii]|uniref:LemA family protein n=1 Tax=Vreelandella stevensii TaxID=502821 RepID=UPI00374863C5
MFEIMIFIFPVLLLTAVYIWYATIISRRNAVLDALSGIDVQLKKRHDLIPNVLTIAKRFMQHERELLEEITKLRSAAVSALEKYELSQSAEDATTHFSLENQLQRAMGKFMVQAEAYPELTSAQPMMHAQNSYLEVETNIAAARRFYNTSVRRLRNSCEIFPGTVLAKLVGIQPYPFYQADPAETRPVDASAYI